MLCNPFNLFNNHILLFNNQVELGFVYVLRINISIKYIYNSINLFIQK